MPGGGLQRSVASLYRRMMPHSDAGEGSDRSSELGRGKGRGKGGPKRGRGKGGGRRRREPSPEPPSQEEEEEEPAQDQEQEREEEEWQADAQEEEGESSEEDTAEDTSTPAVWLRGPSRLPDRPIPVALRPLIRPSGDM